MHPKLVDSILPAYHRLRFLVSVSDLICITGPPAVGKTTLAKRALDENPTFLYSYINCYDVAIPTKFYSKICQAFHNKMDVRKKENKRPLTRNFEPGKPVNGQDFPNYIQEFLDIAPSKGIERFFVILDQIELFRKSPLMDCLVNLIMTRHLKLIIITNETPDDIKQYLELVSPTIAVRFIDRVDIILVRQWTMDDIIRSVLEHMPKRKQDLYRKFVKNVAQLLWVNETRNPREIRVYCQENFESFLEQHTSILRDRILKDCEKKGIILDPNSSEMEELEESNMYAKKEVESFLTSLKRTIQKEDMTCWKSTDLDKESRIPTNTALMIIAAYIATHTKPSDDKKNFIKFQRKHSKRATAKEVYGLSRQFTLERLIHIYLAISRMTHHIEKLNIISNNDFVLLDVQRLEDLNILQHVGGDGIASESKYKMSNRINKEYIARLARIHELNMEYIQGLSQ